MGGCSSDARGGGVAQERERELPPPGPQDRIGQDVAAKCSRRGFTEPGEEWLTLKVSDVWDGCRKYLKREVEDPGWVGSLYSDLRGSCWPREIKAQLVELPQAG